jgi:hypothetical protein
VAPLGRVIITASRVQHRAASLGTPPAVKPTRQIEAAELTNTAGNYATSSAKALLAATRQSDLIKSDKPKRVGGLTSEQMARMERELEAVQQDLKAVELR